MIANVQGVIDAVDNGSMIVNVGGIGLRVLSPSGIHAPSGSVGENARLETTLIVREDAMTLYGFATAEQRDTFELLQTISGVGPKVALAIISTLSPQEIALAVHSGDETALMTVSGVGRKGAQRMLLELAGRLPAPDAHDPVRPGPNVWEGPVRAGLTQLGWTSHDVEETIQRLESEFSGDEAIDVMLRRALQALGAGSR